MKASVEKTDGEEILQTIATRMNKLVKEKVDAVLVSVDLCAYMCDGFQKHLSQRIQILMIDITC